MEIIGLNPRYVSAGVERLHAQPTLGLEITIPALAEACSLGNIDPQHTGGDATTAAITAAITHPVPSGRAAVAVLQPDKHALVRPDAHAVLRPDAHAVLRPNADALGAAAVLNIRRDGLELTDAALARVRRIADADTEAAGPWPGPRPVGDAGDLLRATSALAAVCMDHRRSLQDRVALMRKWILTGHLDEELGIRLRLFAEALEALEALDVQVQGGIAVVSGSHRLGLSLGYRHAPVVVATNPAFTWQGGEPHRKHTVARWNSAHPMGWKRMLDELRAREPGWGGSSAICGSPQGVASVLTQEQVLDVVVRSLS